MCPFSHSSQSTVQKGPWRVILKKLSQTSSLHFQSALQFTASSFLPQKGVFMEEQTVNFVIGQQWIIISHIKSLFKWRYFFRFWSSPLLSGMFPELYFWCIIFFFDFLFLPKRINPNTFLHVTSSFIFKLAFLLPLLEWKCKELE